MVAVAIGLHQQRSAQVRRGAAWGGRTGAAYRPAGRCRWLKAFDVT
ncbi:hypothetical protein [Streptomyces sp. NPDC002133]